MRQVNSADTKRRDFRDRLWPGSAGWIWDIQDKQNVVGFATIPRLLPLIMHLIRDLAGQGTKAGDPTDVYLEFWSRDYGQGIISITDEQECAYASGYKSTRALRTWREHVLKLVELGFIKVERDGNREIGHVLLLNPLAVAHRYHAQGKTPEGWWTAFARRASEINAPIPPPLRFPPAPPSQMVAADTPF